MKGCNRQLCMYVFYGIWQTLYMGIVVGYILLSCYQKNKVNFFVLVVVKIHQKKKKKIIIILTWNENVKKKMLKEIWEA